MNQSEIRQHLQGITAIAVAPFTAANEVDLAGVDQNVGFMVEGGVRSIVVGGNVGEFYTLSRAENDALVARTVKAAEHGEALIIAGVGHGVSDAIDSARRAADVGAHVAMVHEPPHPHATPQGLGAYYEAIAEQSPIPIVPYVSRAWLSTEEIIDLPRRLDPIGVKFAINDLPMLTRVVDACPDTVWVCGTAERWAPYFYACGARGFTSGIVNVSTEQPVALLAALEAGDFEAARKVWLAVEQFERLRGQAASGFNVAIVKEALRQVGRPAGDVRPPATPVDRQQQEKISEILTSWGRLP